MGANTEIGYGDMRSVSVYILAVIALIAVFNSYTSGYQISLDASSASRNSNNVEDTVTREKRQLESFDNEDYGSPANQEEEPSFWDRVVKVALKLFSRFVEWLNSS